MGLAIVAIPEEQDRVWEISSEKVPHLTLLFLGDEASADTQQIMQFVQHATEMTEHGPFYLDVDRRDTLGADDADVVFFSKRSWNLKWIKQFRGQLLQNDAVRTAYDSTEQYDEWTPHLTLGYPETPAKKPNDDRGDHLYSVAFDRIAVWAGDYEGPEFRLEWPDREEFDGPMAVAWADAQKAALAHYAMMDPEGELEHHGVKGMRWGQRNARRQAHAADRAARGIPQKGTARAAVGNKTKAGLKKVGSGLKKLGSALDEHFYETSIYSSVTHEAIHNDVAREIDSKVYKLQSAPKYRGKNLKTDKALETEYHQDVAKVTDAAYRRSVKDHIGENTKGTKEARYVDDARGARIEIRDKQTGEVRREADLTPDNGIQTDRLDHAATTPLAEPNITIPLKLDTNGQIKAVGYVKPKAVAVHTVADVGEQFIIEHYGIKGMRWGFRRSTPEAATPVATSRVPHGNRRKTKIETEGGQNHPAHPDAISVAQAKVKLKKSGTAALSNKELQDVANRVQLEERVKLLTSSKGSKFVKNELENEGKNIAKAGAKKAAKAGVKKAALSVAAA